MILTPRFVKIAELVKEDKLFYLSQVFFTRIMPLNTIQGHGASFPFSNSVLVLKCCSGGYELAARDRNISHLSKIFNCFGPRISSRQFIEVIFQSSLYILVFNLARGRIKPLLFLQHNAAGKKYIAINKQFAKIEVAIDYVFSNTLATVND